MEIEKKILSVETAQPYLDIGPREENFTADFSADPKFY
jgi:hypothetical protein